MTPETPTSNAGSWASEPQLFVLDIPQSLAFYRDKLGFRTNFSWGNPPFYAQVERSGARLNLRRVTASLTDKGLANREQYLGATICVPANVAIDDLFAEFLAADVKVQQPPTDQPWGARNFAIFDIDDNILLFT